MTKHAKKKIAGLSGRNIPPRPVLGIGIEPHEYLVARSEWERERRSKMENLAHHYGIEPGDGMWFGLACKLADEAIVGFKEEEQPGARSKNDEKVYLYFEVERLVVRYGMKPAPAVAAAIADGAFGDIKEKTAHRWYYDMRSALGTAFQSMRERLGDDGYVAMLDHALEERI